MSTARLFNLRKLIHSVVYKSALSVYTQEFNLVVRLHARPENEPKKLVSADILLFVI